MAIVKILSRRSPTYASLIGYILRYIVNEEKTDKAQVYINNLRSSDIAGYVTIPLNFKTMSQMQKWLDEPHVHSYLTQFDAGLSLVFFPPLSTLAQGQEEGTEVR